MPLAIVIEDEQHSRLCEINDARNVLMQLIARADAARTDLNVLNYVDPYGDTVLNALQQDAALSDIAKLSALTQGVEEAEFLKSLTALFSHARRVPHQYVRFVGD